MQKIKILGIAPYEGMKNLMNQVAETKTDVDLTAYIGDLDAGAAIARQYAANYDVILSRGGTAELIRQQSTLPVIEIPLSMHDILRSIRLAENFNDKYALIGFPAITNNAHFLCDVLQYKIDIYTIHNQQEARERLQALAHSGYSMVLCDMITKSLAQQFGIPSILITSGTESVEAAMDQAVSTSRAYRQLAEQVEFYKSVLEEQHKLVYVYRDTSELVYASRQDGLPGAVLERMKVSLAPVLEEQQKKVYCESSGSVYSLAGTSKIIGDQRYVIFLVNTRKNPITLAKNGIQYLHREEAFDQFFNSFYGSTQSSSMMDMTVEQYAQSRQPLMILGEEGTGKEQMVRLVYAKSKLNANPMVTIDCACLNDRSWAFLTENDNSPVCDTSTTLFIKNAAMLDDTRFQQLFHTIRDLGVHQRNRLLLTWSCSEAEGPDERCQQLMQMFTSLTLKMPPLRAHKTAIPNLVSLHISILNMKLAREIIGFEPDALACLQAYDWPYNFDQFKRVIQELVTLTIGSYIPYSLVEKIIKRENQLMLQAPKPAGAPFDTKRTLEEMNLDILMQALAEEGGNQIATARRLGISRTTLWRMLQKAGAIPAPR